MSIGTTLWVGRRYQRRQGKRSTLIAQELPLDNFFGTTLTSGEEEKSVYEQPTDKAVIHSVNCQELIGCKCTPKSASDRFSEERAAAIRRLHVGRNEQARQRKAGKAGNSASTTTHTDDWDPTMEDCEE